jgi:hypothetical protein
MVNNTTTPSVGKKTKSKKPDAVDTNKLVEQHLARLERDMQGDREQEAEIGMLRFRRYGVALFAGRRTVSCLCLSEKMAYPSGHCVTGIISGIGSHTCSGVLDETDAVIEREVKRAMRDLNQSMSGADNIAKIEQLQKKCTALYADMKRQERELQKQKKRADTLQKEKDTAKTELNKATSMKEKLEKLSRETNNENRKLRVCYAGYMIWVRTYGDHPGRRAAT